MKNSFLNHFQDRIKVKIKGKNVERFIKRLVTLQIELYDIEYIRYNEIHVIIEKSDLEKIQEVKTIYEIDVVGIYGMGHFKELLNRNKYMLLSFFVGIIIFFFLTNTIFTIEVVHTDKDLRNLLKQELQNNGIAVGKMKKNYDQIQKIKEKILSDYKDKIEWLEIETVGTKYIIRVEERILNKEKETTSNQDIVAKKSAILLRIEAENGEVIKNVNDYVKAGDTIISGNIKLNEEVKKQIPAKGKIYGEVWYETTVEYPLTYYEEKETGKKNTVFTFQFLNHRIELFNFHKYKHKKIDGKPIIKSNIFPISLTKEKQKEVEVIHQQYTKEEAIEKAIEVATEKIQKKLKEPEKIIRTQRLKVDENESTIVVELFITVMEDITATVPLEEIKEEAKE